MSFSSVEDLRRTCSYPSNKYAIPTPDELFTKYDLDQSGGIYKDELQMMLEDIDNLDGIEEYRKKEYVDEQFEIADLNNDGIINMDEFMLYYFREICFKFPVLKNGHNPGAALYNIFIAYCCKGQGDNSREEVMGSGQFLRLCQDAQLNNIPACTKATIDIIFHQVKAFRVYNRARGAQKIAYPQFLHALLLISEKRRSGFEEVVRKILHQGCPLRAPTMADFIILANHMPTISTPSHRKGGRQHFSTQLQADGSIENNEKYDQQQDINPDCFSSKHTRTTSWDFHKLGYCQNMGIVMQGRDAMKDPSTLWKLQLMDSDDLTMALKRTFERYNKWQRGANPSRMDNIRFYKLIRDCRLEDEADLNVQKINNICARVMSSQDTGMNFIQFNEALRFVAMEKKLSLNEVIYRMVAIGEPIEYMSNE